jgi:hypothetical protein
MLCSNYVYIYMGIICDYNYTYYSLFFYYLDINVLYSSVFLVVLNYYNITPQREAGRVVFYVSSLVEFMFANGPPLCTYSHLGEHLKRSR